MTDKELIKKYVRVENQSKALELLENGYPVQYIIGNVEFYGSIINVNEDVLIPRFETEYLVEKTINYLKKMNKKTLDILEIGTGSGCISIALKKTMNCNIDAIDISNKAIEVAKNNAINNKVNINFNVCDVHKYQSNKLFDLIISNPPYVPYDGEYNENIKYEPQNAIFAQDNGTYFYKIIIEKIKNNLKKDYLIAFEIGDKEGNEISKIIRKYLPNSYMKIEKDLNNYERYLFISNKKEIFE